jgi:hypothetical protein
MDMKTPKEVAKKTAYATVGAPVVVARKVKELSSKMVSGAQHQIDEYATEGEKVTKQLKDRNVVEELEHRMSIDKVQDRVEQLRDQLENTLNNWRESFVPEAEKAPAAAPAAKKPAPKKPAAKKPATKTTPRTASAKKPATKTTPRTASAKKPAAKAAK